MFSGSDSAKNYFKCSVDQMSGKPLYGDKKDNNQTYESQEVWAGEGWNLLTFFIVERERLWINY